MPDPKTPTDPAKIVEALRQLDPDVDDHWTSGGLPAITEMRRLMGVEVTRKEIHEAAPEFERPRPADSTAPTPAPPADDEVEDAPDEVDADDADEETDADLEAARDRAAALRHEIKSMRDGRKQLATEIDQAKAQLDKLDSQIGSLSVELERVDPPMSDAERLRQVQQRSHEERRKRVHAARGLPVVGNKSQLDQSMANSGRRALGAKRPTFAASTPKKK